MTFHALLTNDELVERCLDHGLRLNVPYSQIEAEAVWRGVDVAHVIRAYLMSLLQELDVL